MFHFPNLRVVGALLAALLAAPVVAQDGIVSNPVSQNVITVDGLFTGGVTGGNVVGEWSDVTPQGFLSPPAGTFADLLRTPPGDPNALTYAAVAPGVVGGNIIDGLYLMYAYGPRTNTSFAPGEFIADVVFPMTVDVCGDGCLRPGINVRVLFQGASVPQSAAIATSGVVFGNSIPIDNNGDGVADAFSDSGFDLRVFADVDHSPTTGDQGFETEVFVSGLEGALGFGPSPLSVTGSTHLLVELEVPLLIPASQVTDPNSPFAGGVGGPFGGYSPDPVFWGASVANDTLDPPASAGILTIDPNTGVTTFDSSDVPTLVPEPTTVALLLAGCSCATVIRRRTMGRPAVKRLCT